MQKAQQITHVLLRIVAAFLFIQHGGQKLFGWYGGTGGPEGGPLPPMGAGGFSLDAMMQRGRPPKS